ncbi:calcium/sodium antiporter [Cobetia sp. LC6]|uniref:calcium/sodium antiporter n=1 Tax=Cobetia sp. LC6 TaxID=3050947 RepID=UPI002553478E|nr:calcium/sodium antiporter [Cobetia sp. LC6]MDL2189816.1 calcium/sodium antiporter [Cobetia sp. LC6]
MLYPILAVVIGLIGLVWSADRFIEGAAATAWRAGMSKLLIGMTIVSVGTSAPEIVVSIMASLDGTPDIATGNALGSNIANIGLVLGVTALIAPIPVHFGLVRRELPLLLAATALGGYALSNSGLERLDGILLLALLVFTLVWLFKVDSPSETESQDDVPEMSTGRAIFWLLVGLTVLIASSRALVWGATDIAQALGVPELIIGLTVIAIGTSLPELATSVASALKRHHDIAIGNVIGSNLFNILAVLPVPGLLAPGPVDGSAISRDYPVMLGLTLLLAALLIWQRRGRIGRGPGVILLAGYLAYTAWLAISLTR